eukprot:COSAG03_NODE_49_length_16340_cov_8.317653_6_plen_1844_part_00
MSKAHAQAIKAVEEAAAEKALALKQAEEQAAVHAKEREAWQHAEQALRDVEVHTEEVVSAAEAAVRQATSDAAAKVEAARQAMSAADAAADVARAELSWSRVALARQQLDHRAAAVSLSLEPEQEMLLDWLNDGQGNAHERRVLSSVASKRQPRQRKNSGRKSTQQLRDEQIVEHVSAALVPRGRRRRRVVPRVAKMLSEESFQPSKLGNTQQRGELKSLTRRHRRTQRMRQRISFDAGLHGPKPPPRPESAARLEELSSDANPRALTPTALAKTEENECLISRLQTEEGLLAAAVAVAKAKGVVAAEAVAVQWRAAAAEATKQERRRKLEHERQRALLAAEESAQVAAESLTLKTQLEATREAAVAAKAAAEKDTQAQLSAQRAAAEAQAAEAARLAQESAKAEAEAKRMQAEEHAVAVRLAADTEARGVCSTTLDWIVSEVVRIKDENDAAAAVQAQMLQAQAAKTAIAEQAEAERRRLVAEREAEEARVAEKAAEAARALAAEQAAQIEAQEEIAAKNAAATAAAIARAKAQQAQLAAEQEEARARVIAKEEEDMAQRKAEEVARARIKAEQEAAIAQRKADQDAIESRAHAYTEASLHQQLVSEDIVSEEADTLQASSDTRAARAVVEVEPECCVFELAAAEATGQVLEELAAAEVVGQVLEDLVQEIENESARRSDPQRTPDPESRFNWILGSALQPTADPDRRRESKFRWRTTSNVCLAVSATNRGSSLRKAIAERRSMASERQSRKPYRQQDSEDWLSNNDAEAVVWFLDGMTYETHHEQKTGTGGWTDKDGWVYDLQISLNVAAVEDDEAPPEPGPDMSVTFEEGPAEFSGDGLFALLDTDNSGSIEFAEFERFWSERKLLLGKVDEGSACNALERAKRLFSDLDKDNSGSLDRAEFETLLAQVAKDDATTAYLNEWIAHHLQTVVQSGPADGGPVFPSMGIRWNVPKGREPLTIASVAKGMAAAEKGLFEGMELREVNGRSLDDVEFRNRDLSLDTNLVLEKMKARPLALKLQAPALLNRESTPAVSVTFDAGPAVLSADGLFSLIDTDNSNTIDFAEFERFWRKHQAMMGKADHNSDHLSDGTLEKAKQLFEETDKDKSGTLDRAEFERILAEVAKDDWEAIQDPETGRTVYYANRRTHETRWSHPVSASVNDWIDQHLQHDNQEAKESVPELPSMGVKWQVMSSGSLVAAIVAKGMAASNRGVVEGMVLQRINGDSVQDLRNAGLDTNDLLDKMRSRPLTLQLQSPPPPQIPVKCSGSAVWTLRSVPSKHKALYEPKIGNSETEVLTGTISGSEIVLEGRVADNVELIAASKYSMRLSWAAITDTNGACTWSSELSGETVCHGVHTKVNLSRTSELPQPPFPADGTMRGLDPHSGNDQAERAASTGKMPTADQAPAVGSHAQGEAFVCVLRTIVREGCELDSKQARAPSRSFLEVGDQVIGVELGKTQTGAERIRLDDGGWVSRVSKAGQAILLSESEFFAPADTNNAGVVSKDEFVVWYLHTLGHPPSADDYTIFYAADRTGNGTVSQAEFADCQALLLAAQQKAQAVAQEKESGEPDANALATDADAGDPPSVQEAWEILRNPGRLEAKQQAFAVIAGQKKPPKSQWKKLQGVVSMGAAKLPLGFSYARHLTWTKASVHVDAKGEGGTLAVKSMFTNGTRAAICDDHPMRTGIHGAEFTIRSIDRSAGDPVMRIGVCVVSGGGFQYVDSAVGAQGRVKVQKTPVGFDPRTSRKAATSTALGWGYSVATGKLRHMKSDLEWTGLRGAQEMDRIKMVLDCEEGSLTVFLNDVRLGEMVGKGSGTGLLDLRGKPLAWMVELDKYGDSVSIASM